MNNNEYSNLWHFIETYLPNYSSRDDVLRSDILYRYLTNDDVDEEDKKWIAKEFKNDFNAIKQECIRLDLKFLSESLETYYSQNLR